MAKFIEKVKEFATGKTKEEREYEKEIEKEIRSESLKAELEERRIQNVRLARERIKANAEAKIRSFRQTAQRPQQGFSMFGGYGSPFGEPRKLGTRAVKVKRIKQSSIVPRRFDVVGGFNAKPRKGFRVI